VGPTEEEKRHPQGVLFVKSMYLIPHLSHSRSLLHDAIRESEQSIFGVSRETLGIVFEVINTLLGRLQNGEVPSAQALWYTPPSEARVGAHEYRNHFCYCGAVCTLPSGSAGWIRGEVRR
jgi:hypothetical protein